MSAAVTTGLFALGGVAVGGLVQAAVAHRAERRRDGWAAKKAARLFQPRLLRFVGAQADAIEKGWTWGDLCLVVETNLDEWESHADVLAGTLEYEQWYAVYRAVRGLEQMTWMVNRESVIGEQDRESLNGLMERALEAAAVLSRVSMFGVQRRRVRDALHRARYRLRPLDEDKVLAELGVADDDHHGDTHAP